jgi:hypothetical protein
MMHFLALSSDATAYYVGLEQRRLNARHHVRKILALAEMDLPEGSDDVRSRSPTFPVKQTMLKQALNPTRLHS